MIFEIGTKRLLYIHVPKCGGTSIERALNAIDNSPINLKNSEPIPERLWGQWKGHQLQHATAEETHERYGHAIDSFDYVFSIFRDPLDRMFSEIRWMLTNPYFQYNFSIKNLVEKMELRSKNKFPHYKKQMEFTRGYEKHIEIFDLKSLTLAEEKLSRVTGREVIIPHENKRLNSILPRSAISKETMKKIESALEDDYAYIQKNNIISQGVES